MISLRQVGVRCPRRQEKRKQSCPFQAAPSMPHLPPPPFSTLNFLDLNRRAGGPQSLPGRCCSHDRRKALAFVGQAIGQWTIEGGPRETFGERKALGPSPRQLGTNLKRASKRVSDDLVHDPHFVGT